MPIRKVAIRKLVTYIYVKQWSKILPGELNEPGFINLQTIFGKHHVENVKVNCRKIWDIIYE